MRKRKLLSLVMAMAMVLSLFPATTLAIDERNAGDSDAGGSVKGTNGSYATIAAALDAGETSITLIADLTENVVIPAKKK